MPVLMHYKIIGQNISEYRRELSLTQEQLAERAGISQQFLSKLENGKGVPSVATIMSLCDAMDLEANKLLTRSAAAHDSDAPCRLRSDGSVFHESLTDKLIPENNHSMVVISLEDLPAFDLEIPDPFDN